MLEHLEAQSRRSSVQGNHVNRPTQRLIQNNADLQRTGEYVFRRQLGREKHGHIHVAQCMGLVPSHRAEQIDGHHIWAVVHGCVDVLRKNGFVIHLADHCIPSPIARQASTGTAAFEFVVSPRSSNGKLPCGASDSARGARLPAATGTAISTRYARDATQSPKGTLRSPQKGRYAVPKRDAVQSRRATGQRPTKWALRCRTAKAQVRSPRRF